MCRVRAQAEVTLQEQLVFPFIPMDAEVPVGVLVAEAPEQVFALQEGQIRGITVLVPTRTVGQLRVVVAGTDHPPPGELIARGTGWERENHPIRPPQADRHGGRRGRALRPRSRRAFLYDAG